MSQQNLEDVKITLWDFGKSINSSKRDLLAGNIHAVKQFDPWTVRRLVAQSQDTLLEACDMNKLAHIKPEFQYMYFLHAIPVKSRFAKWPKKTVISEEILSIAHFWGENIENTTKIVNRMNDQQLEELLTRINKGGRGKTIKKGKRK